jgi:hypothetical protein
MTQAELSSLCHRHALDLEEGREVLEQIEEEVASPKPKGIGFPRDSVGSVMEITAHLNDVMWETRPFVGGEFYATAQQVIAMLKRLAAGTLETEH